LDIFDEKLRPEQDSRFSMALKLLRAYVELRRALDADPGTATRALANVESVSRDLGASNSESVANDWLRMFHHKLRLALAVVVKDEGAMRESATAIIDSSWCADYELEHSPAFEMVWLYGFEHEAYFGHGYLEPAVTTSLSSENQIRWTLLLALQDLEHEGNSDSKAAEVISAHGGRAPPWAAGTVASILLDSKDSDLYSAGLVLARYCLHIERTEERYAKPPAWNYEHLSTAQLGELIEGIVGEFSDARANATSSGGLLLEELGDILYAKKAYHDLRRLSDLILTRAPEHLGALFYSALSRQELKQLSAAKPLYERLLKLDTGHRSAYWNLTLILETQGNVDAIEDMLPALEEHARDGAERWIKARDLARAALGRLRQHNAKTDLRSFVRRELATYPALREEPIDGNELSLLEAASLVALLRAADIDHSAWTLGSFDSSSIPFEPTDRFRSALLDLARKGIIRIAESTPPNAFTARDGQLCYYLGQVQWSISPYTLALQGNIRDMARGNWPTHWTAHVEVLSRDLATEECVAYMEYLAEQRSLDPPDRTDSRALFRELLEHCSVGKCWYYIYTGVQSANDYRTKYPVSRAQVSAMMLRRTRERGENAIAKGWDTQYSRIRALPRSHLSAGLHDVLTGWGERAFEEPIRMLNQP
jgi:tetratricopeptide (TPR) repeat protein